jgi:hypothetical protein
MPSGIIESRRLPMPLPASAERDELHQRAITMKAYRRKDGLFDIEAHLVDSKPFEYQLPNRRPPVAAGRPVHDMWLRLVIDTELTIHAVEAASDSTPFDTCPQALASLQALVGERIGKGWAKLIREKLPRLQTCTHHAELLMPLATAAFMGVRGSRPFEDRFPEGARPNDLDTCYAWSAEGEMVAAFFPQFQRIASQGDQTHDQQQA